MKAYGGQQGQGDSASTSIDRKPYPINLRRRLSRRSTSPIQRSLLDFSLRIANTVNSSPTVRRRGSLS